LAFDYFISAIYRHIICGTFTMKKTFLIYSLFILSQVCLGQSYKTQLNQLNNYLKTFDDGYYGYLEVKDGYLYDRFKSGKYSKAKISDLLKAKESEAKRKVIVPCKYGNCVFSTYTDSYHEQMSFSQSKDFNTTVLIDLLNKFLVAYNNEDIYIEKEDLEDLDSDYPKVIEKITKIANNQTTNNSSTKNVKLDNAIKNLNKYLETFDNGYYGHVEVINNVFYVRFKNGVSNYFNLKDISEVKVLTNNSSNTKVAFMCKEGKNCLYSGYLKDYEDYQCFFINSYFDTKELVKLMNDVLNAFNGTTTSTPNNNQLRRDDAANERRGK
jgi:hypothetical protein